MRDRLWTNHENTMKRINKKLYMEVFYFIFSFFVRGEGGGGGFLRLFYSSRGGGGAARRPAGGIVYN